MVGGGVSSGSLLASVRHNGVFIGWDTDVDIYIREEDVPKLKEVFKVPPLHLVDLRP